MTENQLRVAFIALACRKLPDVKLFVRNVGVFRVEGRAFRAGIRGQADIYGYERGTGRGIEIELKSSTGRWRPGQQEWRDWCREWGVPWLLLRGTRLESPEEIVTRWVSELAAYLEAR